MDRRKRILFFPCGGLGNASARTRCYAYLPFLKGHDVEWHVASYSWHKYDRAGSGRRGLFKRLYLELLPLRVWYWLLTADALFFQKLEIPRLHIRVAGWLGKRIVYDLDDAIHMRQPGAESSAADEPQRNADAERKIHWILKRANRVIVSGEVLAEYARRFCRQVIQLPSVVADCVPEPSQCSSAPVIGWAGAPENQAYLRFLEPVIQKLASEIAGLEIWIVTSRQLVPPFDFRHRFIPWSLAAEAEAIPQFTVGIAPLRDDPWCRAKMNYKALAYLSRGAPVVMSPIGFPLHELGEHRERMTAVSADEWYEKLKELLTNPDARRSSAEAGIEITRKKFTAEARCSDFIQALSGGLE